MNCWGGGVASLTPGWTRAEDLRSSQPPILQIKLHNFTFDRYTMKNNNAKKRKNIVKAAKNLQPLFSAPKERTQSEGTKMERSKMADGLSSYAIEKVHNSDITLDPQLDKLKNEILDQIAKLIAPLTAQLAEIKVDLQATNLKADKALDASSSAQREVGLLHEAFENQQERLINLEVNMRQNHLKLRGIDELLIPKEDLMPVITRWLAKHLELEEGVNTLITKAYRIGTPKQYKNRPVPRDIIIEIPDQKIKMKIIETAKISGSILFNGTPVQIYTDLPREALLIRKELKPITDALRNANVRYKWINHVKILVILNGKHHVATNLRNGTELLNNIGVEIPMETSKQNQKRKLTDMLSPQKGSKIPIRNP
ncbi:uncharacterized protein LOC129323900 [Eublepharis macularius]|uniref:Uncharacterized protein LOC129323900 n=1 Tax=Eublepharis macularius TaxID=481883 RepID=A0AA97IW58_EUBMA|nr:uncharacterized protein LOC129323900 [Eublepharis macularius]